MQLASSCCWAKEVIAGQAKVFAEIQLQKMADVTEARKANVAKRKETGKQLTIEAALAVKIDGLVHSGPESSDRPVHKLLGNFSATLDFFGNFQLVEELSVHWATSKFLHLYGHSHAPATR